MRQVLGCFGLILVIFLGMIYAFEKFTVKPPSPLAEGDLKLFETADVALETCLWAYNQKKYLVYQECLGKTVDQEINTEQVEEMKLWGQIQTYTIAKRRQYGDLVIFKLQQDFQAPSARLYKDQYQDYYFQLRSGRWVYLPESFERSIVWLKSVIWSIGS